MGRSRGIRVTHSPMEVPESTSDQQQEKRGFKDIAQTAVVSEQYSPYLGTRDLGLERLKFKSSHICSLAM